MGGKVKRAVGMVAAIAITAIAPEIAPVLAPYLGGSTFAASMLTGAALGAANDKLLLGGSGLTGAITGGIGAGIASYGSTLGAGTAGATGAGESAATGALGTAGTVGTTAGYESALTNMAFPATAVDAATGTTMGLSSMSPEMTSYLSSLGGADVAAASSGLGSTAASLGDTLSSATTSLGSGFRLPNAGAVLGTYAPTAATAAADTASSGLWGTITDAWGGLSDPTKQGIIRAGGQLGSMALSGQFSDNAADAQAKYLKQMSELQKEAYRKKMAAAEGLIGRANYYDPYYYGTQAQNDALVRGTAAKNEALRSMSGSGRLGASDAEARRYNLGTSLNAASQYTQAADTAQNQKVRTIQAGLNAMPDGVADVSGSYAGLYNTQQDYARNLGSIFADLYGSVYSKSSDKDKTKDSYSTSSLWG